MREDLISARSLLKQNHAVAVCRRGVTDFFDGRGIAPLLSLTEKYGSLEGFTVCDKVVGSAAAFLLIEAGASEVYAATASRRAVSLLNEAGITVSYGSITDYIKNRSGDDICPMEKKALTMNGPEGAYGIFKERLAELKNENNS